MIISIILYLVGIAGISTLFIGAIPTTATIFSTGTGILLIIGATVLALYSKYYKIAGATEAIIRTGVLNKVRMPWKKTKDDKKTSGAKVFIAEGAFCIPRFSNFDVFKFEEYVFNINRTGENALLCSDKLLADIMATFKVSVASDKDSILRYIKAAGTRPINDRKTMEDLCQDVLESALRDACTSKKYDEVFADREGIAQEIGNSVKTDFADKGLQLAPPKLTNVAPTKKEFYDPENPQHAIGLAEMVKTIEEQRLIKETITLETDQKVKAKKVEKEKAVLALDQEKAFAESEQEREIAVKQAQNKRAAEENDIAMEEDVEKRRIAKDKALEAERLAKEKALETQGIENQKAVEAAQVTKKQTVEVAERDREVAVAKKDAELAAADKAKNEATAEAKKAEEEIHTVAVVAEAERNSQQQIIAQKATSEKELIDAKNKAEAEAFAIERKAEARKASADADYEAKTKAAEAALQEATKQAEGDQAKKMVDIHVEKERVAVREADVAVTEKELKAKDAHSSVAVELEVKLAAIKAFTTIGTAEATAKGQALSAAQMKIYGDADTLTEIQESFFKGSGISEMIEGFAQGSPEGFNTLTSSLAAAAGALTSKLAGAQPTSDTDTEETSTTDK